MARCNREMAFLLHAGQKHVDQFDDSGLSDMESSQGATNPRVKFVATIIVIAFATMGVVAMIFFRSPSSSPLGARVQALTRLIDRTCVVPRGFCHGTQSNFSWTDCDADGITDPYCFDKSRYCICIGSSNGCQLKISPCLPSTLMCERPFGWCAGPGEDHMGVVRPDLYIYSRRDCDGDGQPDPFCQTADSKTGDMSCGCLQSSNSCFDNFPAYCPDMGVSTMNMLAMTESQVALTSAHSGTLTFVNVVAGDTVVAGDEVFAVIHGDSLQVVTAPSDGVIERVLSVHAGDHVSAGERLVIMDVTAPAALPVPKPDPQTVETQTTKPARVPTPTPAASHATVNTSTPGITALPVPTPTTKIVAIVSTQSTTPAPLPSPTPAPKHATAKKSTPAPTPLPLPRPVTKAVAMQTTKPAPVPTSMPTMGEHLPDLLTAPVPDAALPVMLHQADAGAVHAPSGRWLKLQEFKVAIGDRVNKGDVLAVAIVVNPNGTEGRVLNITAEVDGIIAEEQNISTGDLIGPYDELVVVADKTQQGWLWWLPLLLPPCFCIVLCLCLLVCLQR